MKPICLIPARAGSKGLPHKNMLFLDGKPMMFHTIDAAIESGCFELADIYVNTDSEFYNEICETRGVTSVLRPAELATDFSTSYDFTEHFLQDFDDDQVFVLLQVTSPLRTGKHIREALELYHQGIAENVVSFSKIDKSPKFFTELYEHNFAKDICGVDKGYRRQNDQKELYAPNGAIYITTKKAYLSNKSYFTEKTQAYLMSREDSFDVDERADFTSVIGRIFFDYKRREAKNKTFYATQYQILSQTTAQDKILLGDSRLLGFQQEGYDNFSIGGVTLATILENSDQILERQISHLVLAAGVNDLITGYSWNDIRQNIVTLIEKIRSKHIPLTLVEVPYTLFRDSVNNDDITRLNDYLVELATQYGLKLIATNDKLSQDGHLRYDYTSDGLHFNSQGENIYFEILKNTCTK